MKSMLLIFIGCLLFSATVHAEGPETGYLTGRLKTKAGEPLAGGLVFFFNELAGPPPAPDRYWRVADETAALDSNGFFKAKLLEGKYFIGASKNSLKTDSGPPLDGELCLVDQNADGSAKLHLVKKDEITDIGISTGAVPFRREMDRVKSRVTAIRGTVTDAGGGAVAGVPVFAFISPDKGYKPLFASERTGNDGKYLLRVSGNGSYYLKVRDGYGFKAPVIGSTIGMYGDESSVPVETVNGRIIEGIDIKTWKFMGKRQE